MQKKTKKIPRILPASVVLTYLEKYGLSAQLQVAVTRRIHKWQSRKCWLKTDKLMELEYFI
jgi:hypothetical protein